MQRGKQTLYNSIVELSVSSRNTVHKRNTGIDARRDAMAHRYYFHATINRLRYDDCLSSLQQEFYLQPDTIVKELHQRYNLIHNLVANKVTTAELRKLYPYFNWVSKLL